MVGTLASEHWRVTSPPAFADRTKPPARQSRLGTDTRMPPVQGTVPNQRTYVASARDRPLRVRRGQGAPHPLREGKRNRLSGWVLTASVLRLLRSLARSPALAHTRVLARPLFRLALLALRLGSLPRALSLRPPSSPPHSRSVGSSTRLLLRFLFVGSLDWA